MEGARWYDPEDDELLCTDFKQTLNCDQDLSSRVVMSSSTSESEDENDVGDGNRNTHSGDDENDIKKKSYESIKLNHKRNNNFYKSSSDESTDRNRKFHLYITSFESKNHPKTEISIDKLKNAISNFVHSINIIPSRFGILVTSNRTEDIDKILNLNFLNIFGGPVQIANISKNDPPFKRQIIFKTIPWVITLKEIRHCLEKQGIRYGKVKRTRNIVKIEVLNSNHEDRLLKEGLNFYNTVSFAAVPDIRRFNNINNVENFKSKEVIQCYKCQGFWHTATTCKNEVKCVRCGEPHIVDKCEKPKNDPLCCNCRGDHHAAYKLCPARLRMMNFINSKYKGDARYTQITRASTS